MSETQPSASLSREAFERLLGEMRPKLHRYCARMTGSVIDGEDVVQDALMKAIDAFTGAEGLVNVEAWLFRIAHNTALDFHPPTAHISAISHPALTASVAPAIRKLCPDTCISNFAAFTIFLTIPEIALTVNGLPLPDANNGSSSF